MSCVEERAPKEVKCVVWKLAFVLLGKHEVTAMASFTAWRVSIMMIDSRRTDDELPSNSSAMAVLR